MGRLSFFGTDKRLAALSATLLPRAAVIDAVNKNYSSEQIARAFGTSSELVDYRIKRLGLWREHLRKPIRLRD